MTPSRQHISHESFLDKSSRLVQQGVQVMGTLKGAVELGRGIYAGFQAARPLLALM